MSFKFNWISDEFIWELSNENDYHDTNNIVDDSIDELEVTKE